MWVSYRWCSVNFYWITVFKYLFFYFSIIIFLFFYFYSVTIVCIKDFIYLFLGRGERREKKINVLQPFTRPPHWGPGLKPRHVPWLGIKPTTIWFVGWHSIHWAIPARALNTFFLKIVNQLTYWHLDFTCVNWW